MKNKNGLPIFGLLAWTLLLACGTSETPKSAEALPAIQVKADPCDDPDASIQCCFTNMPAQLSSRMEIADRQEPGDRLIISGTIFKAEGTTPYPDVVMYAYHTDHTGRYTKKGKETGFQKWHGHLHGWCKTDLNGNYEIQTIRPARYPDNTIVAHIHAALKAPDGSEPYYINDFVFSDDQLVTTAYLSALTNPGGTGVVEVAKSSGGVWIGQRNIVAK